MKLKSMISWALIFSFTFLLFQPISDASEIEKRYLDYKNAESASRYQRIHKDLANYDNQQKGLVDRAKAETSNLMIDPDSEDMTEQNSEDESEDLSDTEESSETSDTSEDITNLDISKMEPAFVGINLPEKAYVGDFIQITIAAVIRDNIDVKIDSIDLSISDPKTKKDYFKDSFVNYKNQTKILFTYNWDTYLAQTNAGKHTVTVRVHSKNDKTGLFKNPVTAEINVLASPGVDIQKHGFWGGYLKQDGSLNSFWKNKLDCKSNDDCKTKEQIREHLTRAISDGDFETDETGKSHVNSKFNSADQEELENSFSRYLHSIEINPPTEEQNKITASANALTMTDLNTYIQEEINSKLGIEAVHISEETATAPELYTAIKIYNEYSVKIASYAPESLDELKKAPFWPEMQKKIEDNISKNPIDQIDSLSDLNPDYKAQVSTNNRLLPQKAKAWVQIAVGVGFCLWDIHQIIKRPGDWKNWGMLGLDLLLIPFGGASLAEKLLVGAGRWLGKVLKIGEGIKAIRAWWETSRVGAWLVKTWEVIKWKVWENPTTRAIVKAVGAWASEGWAALTGAFKKAFSFAKAILRWGAYIAVRAWWKHTACPSIKFLGVGSGIDPFAWALCNILKFFYDLAVSIYGYALCLLKKSVGTGITSTKCQLKFGP